MKYKNKEIFKNISLSLSIVLLTAFVTILIVMLSTNEYKIISFENKSNVDYKVYLKKNKYYKEKYISADKQYISELIDYINIDFSSKYDYSQSVPITYSYTIKAISSINDANNSKELYSKEEIMFESKEESVNTISSILNDTIKIQYNKYSNPILKFIEKYNLKNVDSKLDIVITINYKGQEGTYFESFNDKIELTITALLNKDTFPIEINTNEINKDNNYIEIIDKSNDTYIYILIVLGILFIMTVIININNIKEFINNHNNKNKKEKNKINVKKLLKNYESYIHNVDKFDFKGYKRVDLDKFDALLEIKDSLKKPILLINNKENEYNLFIVDNNNIIYQYIIKN